MGVEIKNIKKPKAIKKDRKRRGRGIGSGLGKTSGRGHKGAKSRSGGASYIPGFEGGQMPLIRKLPKRGFNNSDKQKWNVLNINIFQRNDLIENNTVIDLDFLIKNKIIKRKRLPIKILGSTKLTKILTIKANAFSKNAIKTIEDAGGKVEIVKKWGKGVKKNDTNNN